MIRSDVNLSMEERLFALAIQLANNGLLSLDENYTIFDATDTFIAMQKEHDEKSAFTDSLLDYSDEIVSIEEIGTCDTVDISVTGDNLFFCNGILTKNSMGVPMIADFFAAIINTDELKEMRQLMFKQLKNRYKSLDDPNKFMVGVDYTKMKMFDLDNPNVEKSKPQQKEGKHFSEEIWTKTKISETQDNSFADWN